MMPDESDFTVAILGDLHLDPRKTIATMTSFIVQAATGDQPAGSIQARRRGDVWARSTANSTTSATMRAYRRTGRAFSLFPRRRAMVVPYCLPTAGLFLK